MHAGSLLMHQWLCWNSQHPHTSDMKVTITKARKPNHVFDAFHHSGLFPLTLPQKAAMPSPNATGNMQNSASVRFQKRRVHSEMHTP